MAKKETQFFRADKVKKALEKYREKLGKIYSKLLIENIEEEMREITLLLVFLFLDLEGSPHIEEEYIPKMKDGIAKEQAEISLQVAKELVEEPVPPIIP